MAGNGSKTPSLREAQKQLTLRKLLDAARVVFDEKGYTTATVDDIVEAAGASRGTFYLYFHSKGEVLGEIFHGEHIGAVVEMLNDFPSGTDVDELRSWIERYFRLYERDRKTIRAWIQAGSREAGLRATSLAMMDELLEGLTGKVLEVREAMGLDTSEESARLRALLMFLQMQELGYYQYIRDYPVNEALAVELLAHTWASLLSGSDSHLEPAKRRRAR